MEEEMKKQETPQFLVEALNATNFNGVDLVHLVSLNVNSVNVHELAEVYSHELAMVSIVRNRPVFVSQPEIEQLLHGVILGYMLHSPVVNPSGVRVGVEDSTFCFPVHFMTFAPLFDVKNEHSRRVRITCANNAFPEIADPSAPPMTDPEMVAMWRNLRSDVNNRLDPMPLNENERRNLAVLAANMQLDFDVALNIIETARPVARLFSMAAGAWRLDVTRGINHVVGTNDSSIWRMAVQNLNGEDCLVSDGGCALIDHRIWIARSFLQADGIYHTLLGEVGVQTLVRHLSVRSAQQCLIRAMQGRICRE